MFRFELSNYKNVDDSVVSIVNQFYQLLDGGKYSEAYNHLQIYRDVLKHYFVDGDSFNKIELAIYKLAEQQYYSQRIIISNTEPKTAEHQMNEGSEWLQEY